jgi:hypothetical protein
MNHVRILSRAVFILAALTLGGAAQAEGHSGAEVSKIDEGISRVSAYWGCNAPKLVFDGQTYFTIGSWGKDQASSRGVIYRYERGEWTRGYEWGELNYQPPMLLLDSQRRLILVYSKRSAKPVVMRARTAGDCASLEPIAVPDTIAQAGYIGASIVQDRLILCYIGRAGYDFCTTACDLAAGRWTPETVLCRAQRTTVPYTTWLYPFMIPGAEGMDLFVSNHSFPGKQNNKSRILHAFVSSGQPAAPAAEVIADANPWGVDGTAQISAVWRDLRDGALLVIGQFTPKTGKVLNLELYRRDPASGRWDARKIGPHLYGSLFQSAAAPRVLWLTVVTRGQGADLQLFRSVDQGQSWMAETAANLPKGVAPHFLYGVHPTSGSVMPDTPCAVFSAGDPPRKEYSLWFVRFDARPPA